jgi:hypothetical protein
MQQLLSSLSLLSLVLLLLLSLLLLLLLLLLSSSLLLCCCCTVQHLRRQAPGGWGCRPSQARLDNRRDGRVTGRVRARHRRRLLAWSRRAHLHHGREHHSHIQEGGAVSGTLMCCANIWLRCCTYALVLYNRISMSS